MSPVIVEDSEVITFPYYFNSPKIGDVIVFKHKMLPFIFCKRIKKIVGGKIWVEGVNKKVSVDSRRFGFICIKSVLGKVIFNF